MYTPGQAAKKLHISPSRLRELSLEGKISASSKTPGGHRRYTDEDLSQANALLSKVDIPVNTNYPLILKRFQNQTESFNPWELVKRDFPGKNIEIFLHKVETELYNDNKLFLKLDQELEASKTVIKEFLYSSSKEKALLGSIMFLAICMLAIFASSNVFSMGSLFLIIYYSTLFIFSLLATTKIIHPKLKDYIYERSILDLDSLNSDKSLSILEAQAKMATGKALAEAMHYDDADYIEDRLRKFSHVQELITNFRETKKRISFYETILVSYPKDV